MSRIFSATYHGTITNAGGNVDLFSLQPADDAPIELCGFLLSQISEVADAAEEGLQITVNRLPATFTVGSGGGAVTATKPLNDSAGSAFGATVRANDTTVATTSGTLEELHAAGWNERNSPYDFFWPDARFYPQAKQTIGLGIRQDTTAADDYTGVFTCWFTEP